MFDKPCAAEFFKWRKYPTPRSRMLEDMTTKKGLKNKIFTARRDCYKGEWKDNLKDGWGLYLANDKSKSLYEGHWKKHKADGFGVHSICLKNGKYKIMESGSWKNGKPDGMGFSYKNGNYYEGTFEKGKKQGHGRMWYKNGNFYEGKWKNDKRHGLGLFVFSNGNRYEGEFFEGMKQGAGVLYHLKTGQAQEGIWIDDNCVTSHIRDIQFRQAAISPTPYPIPDVGLLNWEQVISNESKAHAEYLFNRSKISPPEEVECIVQKKCICQIGKKCDRNWL
ncbi:MORN repeat-containing protein 3-like isoform X2 [Cimex lectularius]|uniref:MORN repeat-containing protein 3 n=1 Tax=Cimex lectularius TaxID=79782 RepID=A0A8I6RFH1_CIMLE|nr:MORN repeat-containing protein 3-like isoform X2 [Cimex lectularius]